MLLKDDHGFPVEDRIKGCNIAGRRPIGSFCAVLGKKYKSLLLYQWQ